MLPRWMLPVWAVLVVAGQGFHVAEHVLQVYQKYGLQAHHAHGLLGQYFGTDAVHLVMNTIFLVALMPFAVRGGDPRNLRWQLFLGGVWAGAYHVVEHAVKAYQSMVMGHDPAQGIIGHFGPLIPLHAWLNLVVYTLVLPHLLASALPVRRAARARVTVPSS